MGSYRYTPTLIEADRLFPAFTRHFVAPLEPRCQVISFRQLLFNLHHPPCQRCLSRPRTTSRCCSAGTRSARDTSRLPHLLSSATAPRIVCCLPGRRGANACLVGTWKTPLWARQSTRGHLYPARRQNEREVLRWSEGRCMERRARERKKERSKD